MEKILLRPIRSELYYRGSFKNFAFDVLAQPIPLYKVLLKHFGKFGLALKDIRYDTVPLADANVTGFMLDLHSHVRVGLDALGASFTSLHNVGVEVAGQMVLDLHLAVREVDPSAQVAQHRVDCAITSQITNGTNQQLIERYVTAPPTLRHKAKPALIFYLDPDAEQGMQEGIVALDRVPGKEQELLTRITAAFDAGKVPVAALRERFVTFVEQHLSDLGLELSPEERK